MKIIYAVLFGSQLCVWSAYAQGTFENLDFEQANLSAIPAGQFGSLVPIVSAFPGWSGTDGFAPFTQVLQNSVTFGEVSIDIFGPNWNGAFLGTVIQGSYTAVLQAGDATQGHVPATLSQTGLVPGNAKSMLFEASGNVAGYLNVAFAGQNLPYYPLAAGSNYELYGMDVSDYAGQTGQLSFSENPTSQSFFPYVLLDNIQFSVNPIPEPRTRGLILCGAAVFGVSRWRKRGFGY